MISRANADAQNHWLSLELRGTKGNLLALNARAKVTSGELEHSKIEVSGSGGSYLSQNDLRLQFCLAEACGRR